MPQRNELSFASQTFDTLELNGSFYSLQAPSSYKAWRQSAPATFVFAVKGSRFITHMKALRDVDIALANFFASGPLSLGPMLGPILWQLPARARFDAERLENFFRLLPKNTDEASELASRHDHRIKHGSVLRAEAFAEIRHAFEPRHESFGCIEARRLFQKYRVALVVSDGAEMFPTFQEMRASFTYVRLHGDAELYRSRYSQRALAAWAEKIEAWRKRGEVFVYFDNTANAHAPFDALALRKLVDETAPTGSTSRRIRCQ